MTTTHSQFKQLRADLQTKIGTALAVFSILFLAPRAHADDARVEIVWFHIRKAATVKISVDCGGAEKPSFGTGFMLDGRYVITARHLFLVCSSMGKDDFFKALSTDQKEKFLQEARTRTHKIQFEFADRSNNYATVELNDRVYLADNADFAYVDFGVSSVHRPSICLSKLLKFERGQAVSFFGYGAGASGAAVSATITDPLTDARIARSDAVGGPGFSGAPVLNMNGNVVGIVIGGEPGGTEYFLPLVRVLPDLNDLGLAASRSTEEPKADAYERFAKCPLLTQPPQSYNKMQTINVDSNWMGGGSDPTSFCRSKTDELRNSYPPSSKFVAHGFQEESRKDWLGHVEYHYACSIDVLTDPVFGEGRSPACGLRDLVNDPLNCD